AGDHRQPLLHDRHGDQTAGGNRRFRAAVELCHGRRDAGHAAPRPRRHPDAAPVRQRPGRNREVSTMASIDISGVNKVYAGGVTAIHSLDLAIPGGELVVLVGPSGCGKSTLLRMIAGLEAITGGTISIDGAVVNTKEPAERDIAVVFQN